MKCLNCFMSCNHCSELGNLTDNKCTECLIDYEPETNLTGNCIPISSGNKWYIEPNEEKYIITEDDKAIVYITDTGYVNSKYFKQI